MTEEKINHKGWCSILQGGGCDCLEGRVGSMIVKLLRYTEDPVKVVWESARNCYSPKAFSEIEKEYTAARGFSMVKNLIKNEHESPLEHVNFTFCIEGASRSFLAQLTRHRLASYTVSSQHFQDHSDFMFKELEKSTGGLDREYRRLMGDITVFYKKMISRGIPIWVAREILPNSCLCKIIMTANLREMRHIIKIRIAPCNTPEIKKFALIVKNIISHAVPCSMDDVGG